VRGRKKARYAQTFKTLSEALRVKADKEWYLQNLHRGVQDPTLPDPRVPISTAINAYLDEIKGSKATKKAHRHDLREFEAWNEGLEQRKKKYVEEIDKAHLRRFFEYLVDDEPENCPFTAAWKLLRLNKFIRTVLHLDPDGESRLSRSTSPASREMKTGVPATTLPRPSRSQSSARIRRNPSVDCRYSVGG
jgi:hypothetical protein